MRSGQEMDQSWLRTNHCGFLTFGSLDPFTLEKKIKGPQRAFCLCGILKIDIYFTRNENLRCKKKKMKMKSLALAGGSVRTDVSAQ